MAAVISKLKERVRFKEEGLIDLLLLLPIGLFSLIGLVAYLGLIK